jgi:hypothetical protein
MPATNYTDYAQVDVRNLHVDSRYQRFCRPAAVKAMVKEWDPALEQNLTLNHKTDSDRYTVVDGNHRVTAKLERLEKGMDDDPIMWAQVHQDLSLVAEADLFTKLNAQRVNATPVDKFNGAVISGDRLACLVSRALTENGMSVGYTKSRNVLNTVGGMLQVVKSVGANDTEATEILSDTLRISQQVFDRWGSKAYRRENTEAIAMLMDRAWTVFPREKVNARLEKVLVAHDPWDIYTKGKARAIGNNRPSRQLAEVMLELYNFKMKRNILPQWNEMERRSARRV